MSETEQEIKLGIKNLFKKTYHNIIFNMTNEHERVKQQLADAQAENKRLKEAFSGLLEEAKVLYIYYPNSFRKTTDEYFADEIKIAKEGVKS